MAPAVRARLGPDDAVGWLTREPDLRQSRRKTWMLRLVDAAAAISARGFPAVAELSVTLRVQDAARPANSGLRCLTVSGGRGSLTPFETARGPRLPSAAPVMLGARGLAALYGGVPMAALRGAGLASGGDRDADAALDCAFAGPAFMLDDF
jgi:predicted acetyltransferase